MTNLQIAICTPIFPNAVQTYIANQILESNKSGAATIIIAEKRGQFNSIYSATEQADMLSNTLWIDTEQLHLVNEIITLPIFNKKYIKSIKQLITSGFCKTHGWKNFVRSIAHAKTLAFRDFEILHSHNFTASYKYLFLKSVFGIPLITTFHGKEPRGSRNLSLEKIRTVFRHSNSIIVNTPYSKNILMTMGCPEELIHIIPQGLRLDSYPYVERRIDRHRKTIVLTVSRLSVEKGHAVAIKAVSRLCKEFPELEYLIVGTGPEKNQLEKLIETTGLQKHIKLLGQRTGNDLLELYARAHIFVLPSIDTRDEYLVETQGVVLQEAQSSGLPVIGSRTGGIPDVINDEVSGLLFDEGNDQKLADKIRTLILDQNLYSKLCIEGRRDVEKNYDIKKINDRILAHYSMVLQHNAPEH